MLKFIRGRGKDRSKHLKDFFAIQKTSLHGFPHHPTALAFDPVLGIIAVASKKSSLRVYGKAGVEFAAELDADLEVRQIKFIPGSRGQLVLLAEDGTIQLWEINGTTLEKKRSTDHFTKEEALASLKTPTTFEICLKTSTILVGTQGGNIHTLNLDTLEFLDQVIYQDVVLQNVPAEHKKSSQGSVEVIALQPSSDDSILIGYQRGLIALWNNASLTAEHYYAASQQLESASWLPSGEEFVSSHNDGSIINWKVSDNLTPSEASRIPYGPFPCKAISKIAARPAKNGEYLTVFSGGMPRASYGDKMTVTIVEGEFESGKHHVLDFSSKVVDFEIIDSENKPVALIVLLEEELVAIDLTSPEWLQFKLPYLSSVHSSGITSSSHYSNLSDDLFKSILEAGAAQNSGKFSSKPWPLNGGAVGGEESVVKTNDLLITGHEDGSICLWNASDVALGHILTVQTRKMFIATDSDISPIDGDDEVVESADDPSNEWPPFRKVGTFDPFSDDVRLAIRNVLFCSVSGQFIASGTAGQLVSFKLSTECAEKVVPVISTNIVEDAAGFVWKGHDQLHLKNGSVKFEAGLVPEVVVQISPPAAVTAIALNSEWNLLAAGTAHGFVIVDLLTNKVLLSKTTLSAAELAATAEGGVLITRRKSFKKSLRESFRRLRKGRGSLRKKASSPTPAPASSPVGEVDGAGPSTPAKETPSSSKVTSPVRSLARGAASLDDDSPRMERQIEAKGDDGLGSMIRFLYLAPANISSATVSVPTLWVGTNAGTIYVHTLTIPEKEKRSQDEVSIQLAKEIQLKHRAPVIFIQIIDSAGVPVASITPTPPPAAPVEPEEAPVEGAEPAAPVAAPVAVEKVPVKAAPLHNRVLIVSEEQFKLFQLPSLKPDRKAKLTAHEGSRVRKVAIASFHAKEENVEHCLASLSNQGDVSIYDLADLKRQINHNLIPREDVLAIASAFFTNSSEGFFLHSPSEFQRFSLTPRRVILPTGIVEIPEGVRPVVVEPVVEPKAEVTEPTSEPAAPEPVVEEQAEAAIAPVVSQTPVVEESVAEAVVTAPEPMEVTPPEPEVVVAPVPSPVPVAESVEPEAPAEMTANIDSEADFPSLMVTDDLVDPIIASNGHEQVNGHNGDSENGVNGDDGTNGTTNGASSPLNDTDMSYATNDITIDSVRDFTNLNLSDSPSATDKVPKKVVTPTPPAALVDDSEIGD